MRDPLRNVSVRYKLAFAFAGVCLLAFGVGGYLVSRSAMASLEREIFRRLEVQSEAHAAALESSLAALGQRARDFASDGYIREQFAALEPESEAGPVGDALRMHLVENKLPIVPGFLNLAVVTAQDAPAFLARRKDAAWVEGLGRRAFGEQDWHSGFRQPEDPQGFPYLVLATPLRSLAGGRRIGTLLAKVHPGVWISSALGSVPSSRTEGPARGTPPKLELIDDSGQVLAIPAVLQTPAPTSSDLVLAGFGLRLVNATRESDAPERGVFTRPLPLANGWTLETALDSRDAFEAVSGLQARILIIGVVLTVAASLLLLFPMRFLARPLSELQNAAKEMRAGKFSARVKNDSTDEVGELARSFNLMAEAVEQRAEELQATAHDLEQRKDELRHERDRLDAVIRSMRDGLIVLDPDGQPVVWNTAAQPLIDDSELGVSTWTSHRDCQEPHANGNGDPGADESPCRACLFDPAAPPRSCLIDVGPSVYEVRSTRLNSEARGRSGRVLVAREVTDRIAQDERQIHQERLAVLGEVAAVVAHELNNPLAAIRMFAQMVVAKLPQDSELREDVEVIERNTHTCSRTIRELLDYATGATPEVGSVDVHATLEDVARFLRAMRERKEIELVLTLEASDAVVVGDEVQLRQVFVNLVMNALQAVDELEERGGQVEVRTWIDSGHLVVDVIDDGPGIPETVGQEIFKPFYTTKPRGTGTGLGLPTARRITEIQGGSLELTDAGPGRTTFRVRLLRGNA